MCVEKAHYTSICREGIFIWIEADMQIKKRQWSRKAKDNYTVFFVESR
jgi:hypothetical protein